MLSLNNIEVIHDGVILVLKGASLNVREAEITILLGPTAPARHHAEGDLGPARLGAGRNHEGAIELGGERIDRLPPHAIVRRGVVQVLEGRRVFEHLTTEANFTKGRVVEAITAVPSAGWPLLGVSDDRTDGDLFGALPGRAGHSVGPAVARRSALAVCRRCAGSFDPAPRLTEAEVAFSG